MNKIRQFFGWQSEILKQHYGDDSTGLFFATTLAFILLSCATTMAVLDAYFILVDPKYFATYTKIAMLPVYIIPVISFVLAYHYLIQGRYKLARNIFAAITIMSIISSINLTGGFFNSIAAPFIVVVPVMVFLLYGMRAGTYIAIAVPIYMALQETLFYLAGIKIPNFTSIANPQLNAITTNLSLYLLVIAMVASYEFQRASLKKNLDKERRKLADWANRDPLTNLSNSRYFYSRLNDSFSKAQKSGKRLVIMYLDLNRFKSVNDNFGHQTGDNALIKIAGRIENCVAEKGLVARMGGDEFIVLLNETITDAQIKNLKTCLVAEIEKPIIIENIQHELGTSIGQAIFPDDCASVQELLKKADEAMYRDKKQSNLNRAEAELEALIHLPSQKSASI